VGPKKKSFFTPSWRLVGKLSSQAGKYERDLHKDAVESICPVLTWIENLSPDIREWAKASKNNWLQR
jgi:hypothetical protein